LLKIPSVIFRSMNVKNKVAKRGRRVKAINPISHSATDDRVVAQMARKRGEAQ
jgi:hypothetical protein